MNAESALLLIAHWWWIGAIVLYAILNAVMQRVLTARAMCLAYAALSVALLWWNHAPMWAWLVAGVWFSIYGIELVLSDFLVALREMHEQQLTILRCMNSNAAEAHSELRY